ncbi:Hcp family type VI secretion system effector [Arenibaculum pallidiluteum]|uniref:type VI secretion system tube protein Hcp n=1 Tax=Arenibaculum pallidiluteum TaxID=2812559 RepID=UPI001A95A6C5|nr:type VI secretion system tube protein Hcp [Arenibaculum pallidiluteum]
MQLILLSYPDVTGEVTLKDKTNLIACNTVKFNIKNEGGVGTPGFNDAQKSVPKPGERNGGDPRSGSTSNPESGVSAVTLTRKVDRATPKFMELAFAKKGEEEKEATITVYRVFERQVSNYGTVNTSFEAAIAGNIDTDPSMVAWHEPIMKITLKGVRIASHEVDIGASELTDTVQISFKEISLEYFLFKNGKSLGVAPGKVTVKVTNPGAA